MLGGHPALPIGSAAQLSCLVVLRSTTRACPHPPATLPRHRSDELLSYDTYDEGVYCRSRIWLLMAYALSLGAIAGSVLVMLHRGGEVSSILQVGSARLLAKAWRSAMATHLHGIHEHWPGTLEAAMGWREGCSSDPTPPPLPLLTRDRWRASLERRSCSSRRGRRAKAAAATTHSELVMQPLSPVPVLFCTSSPACRRPVLLLPSASSVTPLCCLTSKRLSYCYIVKTCT